MILLKDLGMIPNKSGNKYRMGEYQCPQCLGVHNVYMHNAKKAKTNVCSTCVLLNRNTTHGKSASKAYQVWNNMMGRCYRESHKNYHRWGGRGITVVGAWHDFETFEIWFNKNYVEDFQIDRIDNDAEYSPDNCRFTSRDENIHNSSICIASKSKSKYRYISRKLIKGHYYFQIKFKGTYLGSSSDEEKAYEILCQHLPYQEYLEELSSKNSSYMDNLQ
jgi:hypothetical protein